MCTQTQLSALFHKPESLKILNTVLIQAFTKHKKAHPNKSGKIKRTAVAVKKSAIALAIATCTACSNTQPHQGPSSSNEVTAPTKGKNYGTILLHSDFIEKETECRKAPEFRCEKSQEKYTSQPYQKEDKFRLQASYQNPKIIPEKTEFNGSKNLIIIIPYVLAIPTPGFQTFAPYRAQGSSLFIQNSSLSNDRSYTIPTSKNDYPLNYLSIDSFQRRIYTSRVQGDKFSYIDAYLDYPDLLVYQGSRCKTPGEMKITLRPTVKISSASNLRPNEVIQGLKFSPEAVELERKRIESDQKYYLRIDTSRLNLCLRAGRIIE